MFQAVKNGNGKPSVGFCYLLYVDFSLGLFFVLEDVSDIFLRIVG
jgi:hypothetical protein